MSVKTSDKDVREPRSDAEFTLVDSDDSTRLLRIEVPITLVNNGVPQSRVYILRENIPDFTPLSAPESSDFIAIWGNSYRVDASAGDVMVTLPDAAVANGDLFIQIHRVDTSANVVTVYTGQEFFDFHPAHTVIGVDLRPGGTLNIRSISTLPVVTNYSGITTAHRLWTPGDVGAAPVLWYRFRDAATITLVGSDVDAITNQGSMGATFDLVAHDAGSRPSLVGGLYANFVPTRSLRTAAVQPAFAGAALTLGMGYLKNNNVSDFAFMHALTSRVSAHIRWGDNNTYIDAPISSRISGNISSIITGPNPKSMVIRKGATSGRGLFVDGRPTPSMSAAGAGNALSGSGYFALGSEVTGTPSVAQGLSGRMYEFVAYNVELSDADRDRLSAYLLWDIGAAAEINATSPYTNVPPLTAVLQY